ncbi:MAG: aminomethyltransferase family protein [Acidobacteriota bacterium]|nr:aminomethyltransferase family protein [Blastocatellia bacterium]MDW8240881.1 aminomethyltransferase family protein [Acidobacteriota bacterium]
MKTLLYSLYQARRATFTEYQGWQLPDRFVGVGEEYGVVRSAVGIIDISHRTLITLTGPDRAEFLHRILSQRIKGVPGGCGCHAALLTPQGKMIAVMRVLIGEDTILLESEPAARASLLEKLALYRLSQRVEIEDVTEQFVKLSLQGPHAVRLLQALLQQEVAISEQLQHQQVHVNNIPLRAINVQETGESGFELMAPVAMGASLWSHLLHVGAPYGLQPVGFAAFNVLRVEAGTPWYGVDMDDSHFPQEAQVDYVLDWTKGCYVGQEPMARIRFRGHVNRKLVGLRFDKTACPEQGNQIVSDGRAIGYITSAVHSFYLDAPIALGYVRREYSQPDTELVVQTRGGEVPAVVSTLPFYPGVDLVA